MSFGDAPERDVAIDFDAECAARPGEVLNEKTDQIITWKVGDAVLTLTLTLTQIQTLTIALTLTLTLTLTLALTWKVGDEVLTELIIRLCNDFPTTEREVRYYMELGPTPTLTLTLP